MHTRFIMPALLAAVGVIGLSTASTLVPVRKIHDPVRKEMLAKDIRFWEAEYLDAIVRRYDVKHQTGEFKGIDPAIYDEFEQLVENDFQNTEDQLARARNEYSRYQ
jgi:hypothetical protein